MSTEALFAGFAVQLSLLAGMALLVVIFLVANRRSKTLSMSRNDRRAERQWNAYAIGAFIGSFFIPVIPAIAAIFALVQISKTKERGMALAIAALVVQVVVFVVLGIFVLPSLTRT
jgi:uncharacterized membrane protein